MKKTRRTSKVGDLLRQEISNIIHRDLDDEALTFVSVTAVEISTDLRFARVFVSALGEHAELEQVVSSLQKARSRVRHLLGQRVSIRYTPELDFQADMTSITASSIERILLDVMPGKGETDDDSTN